MTLLLTLLPALAGCDRCYAFDAVTRAAAGAAGTHAERYSAMPRDFRRPTCAMPDDQIIQFNTSNELIWTADGTRLPGYRVRGGFG